jgi:hypothetical protein
MALAMLFIFYAFVGIVTTAPVYGVYISQIIPCTHDCILYLDFLRRYRYLSTKLRRK